MDNPQHYQPLSHALHPPQVQAQPTYTATSMFNLKAMPAQTTHREEEEEEEEEEDGDDEGLVEEQLNRQEPDGQGSDPSSPRTKPTGTDTRTGQAQQSQRQDDSNSQDRKRRPGRPRGSKNRKPRVGQTTPKQETTFYHPTAGVTPPQHPDVNAHNQQYYEFQWRVLNLCAEFYGAAEELVKGTQPLVIAQCYQMGPGNKVDPMVMLNEAKRICDTLLANPSQLISSPPPPMYSAAPTLYQPAQTQPVASTSAPARSTASTSKSTTPSAVISNPGTFVMPLPPAQTGYPHTQYSMYAPPPGQYPTTPYYQYSYVTPGSYYHQPQHQAQTQPVAQAQPAATQPQPVQPTQPEASSSSAAAATTNVITPGTAAMGNQGAWSDEETERLKKLAEDSRTVGAGGEMEWDWVVHQWGNGRTRHQILIKATSLGLKESSSRGVKRRRENEGTSDAASPSVPPTPTAAAATTHTNANPTASNVSASPAHSQTASTPVASPALQTQQRPVPKPAASGMPWPMPTVAVNTPSPVITTAAAATGSQEQQRTSYYRARPNQDATGAGAGSSKPPSQTTHSYMFQPNGAAGSSRLGKENGK